MIKSRRTKPRPGRLKGEALSDLRHQCFERDSYRCRHVTAYTSTGLVLTTCLERVTWDTGHMAHIESRGRGGKDVLANVLTKCAYHHMVVEHTYGPSGVKPCPSKQSVYETPDVGPIWAEGGEN